MQIPKLTPKEEDLMRWLYLIAGFSRAKLAEDFEVPIAAVDEIVSRDLARVLNPATQTKAPVRRANVDVSPATTDEKRKALIEICRRVFAD